MKQKQKQRLCALSFLLFFTLLGPMAEASEIPISEETHRVDDRELLIQVYEVGRDVDPESLVEENPVRGKIRYQKASIVKKVLEESEEKEVTKTVTVTLPGKNAQDALSKMPATILYEKEGFKGTLYAVPGSLKGSITGKTTHSGTKAIQKTYQREYNDDALIPQESDGFSLKDVNWEEGPFGENSSVPEAYVAKATYVKPYRYTTVNGWKYSMDYTGMAEKVNTDRVCYTVTYEGSPIGLLERLFGYDSPVTKNPFLKMLVWLVLFLLGLLLLASLLLLLRYLWRLLHESRAIVYARDELTGGFYEIKRKWLHGRDLKLEIDPLIAPASVLFRVKLPPMLAYRLKSRTLRIEAAETVLNHKIEGRKNTEEVIDVPVK